MCKENKISVTYNKYVLLAHTTKRLSGAPWNTLRFHGLVGLRWFPLSLASVYRSGLNVLWKRAFFVGFPLVEGNDTRGQNDSNDVPQMCITRIQKVWKKSSLPLKLLLEHHTQATHISLTKRSHVHQSKVSGLEKSTLQGNISKESSGQFWINLTYWGGVCMFALFSFIFIYFLLCTSLYFSNLV